MITILIWAAVASLQAADTAPTATPVPDSEPVAAAKANRSQVKTMPVALDSSPGNDQPERALRARVDAARALGHHGTVVVEGIIGIDGRFSDTRVRTSSRAPELDAVALDTARASIFSPAKDAAGVPIAIWAVMPSEFMVASFGQGNLPTYRCDAFARDMDWWQTTWPDSKRSDHTLYLLVSGIEFLGVLNAVGVNRAAAQLKNSDFDERWVEALATCRAKPSMRFVKAVKLGRK